MGAVGNETKLTRLTNTPQALARGFFIKAKKLKISKKDIDTIGAVIYKHTS